MLPGRNSFPSRGDFTVWLGPRVPENVIDSALVQIWIIRTQIMPLRGPAGSPDCVLPSLDCRHAAFPPGQGEEEEALFSPDLLAPAPSFESRSLGHTSPVLLLKLGLCPWVPNRNAETEFWMKEKKLAFIALPGIGGLSSVMPVPYMGKN